jgi:hypothetical protein
VQSSILGFVRRIYSVFSANILCRSGNLLVTDFIPPGVAAGQKRVRNNISSYVKSNNMTIQNDKGKTVSVEEFLEASGIAFERNRGLLVLGVVISVLLLMIVIGIVLFLL